VVFKNKTVEDALDQIKTENRSIGQKTGKASKLGPKEIQICESQKRTLEKYRRIVQGLQGAAQFLSTPKKAGKGLKNKLIDVIYYSNVEDLCANLKQLVAAKQAGNTGLDNSINSVLDELLRVEAIDKPEYNNLYKNIFL